MDVELWTLVDGETGACDCACDCAGDCDCDCAGGCAGGCAGSCAGSCAGGCDCDCNCWSICNTAEFDNDGVDRIDNPDDILGSTLLLDSCAYDGCDE